MKDVEEALSSSALASIVDPSGALTNTRQVISKALDFNLTAVYDATSVGLFELGGSEELLMGVPLCVSTCNKVWWGFWHFLHLWLDLHCLTKCPELRQFMHRLLSFRVEILLSCGNALNFAQAYRGCFSFVQRVLADLELAVKEATALPGPAGRLGGSFLTIFLVEEKDDSDA